HYVRGLRSCSFLIFFLLYLSFLLSFCFFFFQAEDGIRDRNVTGVQTCALPIFRLELVDPGPLLGGHGSGVEVDVVGDLLRGHIRSEERRVGKECRSRWWPYH